MRDVSLSRWKIKYNKDGNIKRKIRDNKNLKITPDIIDFTLPDIERVIKNIITTKNKKRAFNKLPKT